MQRNFCFWQARSKFNEFVTWTLRQPFPDTRTNYKLLLLIRPMEEAGYYTLYSNKGSPQFMHYCRETRDMLQS
jgi:hypothetical protein